MVKANRQHIAAALSKLDPRFRGILVYGPDEGLVRERSDILARQVVDDPSDPFRVARLGPEEVKAEPAVIGDEMAAISMLGGQRLVRLDGAQDGQAEAIRRAVEREGDSLLVVTAGELSPRSRLRKLFEQSKILLAIACYPEEGQALSTFLREALEAEDLRPSADALAYLADSLGGDRQLLRRELEKLVLYKAGDSDRTLTLEDARACVGDSADRSLSDIAEAVTGGQVEEADSLLQRAYGRGENAVGVLRILAQRLQRLQVVRAHMDRGQSAAKAAEQLSPPLFFKEREAFLRHVERWSASGLDTALARVQDAEADCKSTGMPAEAICARLCLQLAAAARRR